MSMIFNLGKNLGVMLIVLGVVLGGLGLGAARGADKVTVWAGSAAEKAVALTFDDGPSQYTPQIMAVLQKYQAHGTFFVIGRWVEQHPDLVSALLAHGHEVGNHSFSHPHFPDTGRRRRQRELARTAVDLDLLGCPKQGRLFRPPYSQYDKRLKTYIGHTQRHLVLWSIDSGDWRGLAAPAIIDNVLNRVRNGAIIIFHDGDEKGEADREPTVEALKTVVPALKAGGYRMVTVSELLHLQEVGELAGQTGK
jgi:peptidoglycan/xylan/chitin deacetylase (PgdA/CDA1 family)